MKHVAATSTSKHLMPNSVYADILRYWVITKLCESKVLFIPFCPYLICFSYSCVLHNYSVYYLGWSKRADIQVNRQVKQIQQAVAQLQATASAEQQKSAELERRCQGLEHNNRMLQATNYPHNSNIRNPITDITKSRPANCYHDSASSFNG